MTKPFADLVVDQGLRARAYRWWYRRVTWPRQQRKWDKAVSVIRRFDYYVISDHEYFRGAELGLWEWDNDEMRAVLDRLDAEAEAMPDAAHDIPVCSRCGDESIFVWPSGRCAQCEEYATHDTLREQGASQVASVLNEQYGCNAEPSEPVVAAVLVVFAERERLLRERIEGELRVPSNERVLGWNAGLRKALAVFDARRMEAVQWPDVAREHVRYHAHIENERARREYAREQRWHRRLARWVRGA